MSGIVPCQCLGKHSSLTRVISSHISSLLIFSSYFSESPSSEALEPILLLFWSVERPGTSSPERLGEREGGERGREGGREGEREGGERGREGGGRERGRGEGGRWEREGGFTHNYNILTHKTHNRTHRFKTAQSVFIPK